MSSFNEVIQQLKDNKEQNRKSLSNVNSNIAYQNDQLRKLIDEQGQVVKVTEQVVDETKKGNKNNEKNTKGMMGQIKDTIKNDMGGGLKDLGKKFTAPMKGFVEAVPGLKTMGKVAGILSKPATDAGAAAVEKAREAARERMKQLNILESIKNGIIGLKDTFLAGLKNPVGFSIGGLAALIAAPVIALAAFFKELAVQIKWFDKLTGGRLGKIFAPIGKFFDALDDIVKKAGTGRFLRGDTTKLFGRFTETLTDIVGRVKKIFRPIMRGARSLKGFMAGFEPIAKFARGVGKILGRFFLPVTILMTAWDAIKGAIAGYEDGGWLGALEGGITGLINSVIGFPLDLVKSGVEWLLKKVGWDEGAAVLAGFSFTDSITKIVGAFFDVIDKGVTWVKTLFTDPVAALTALWTGIVGEGGLMDIIWAPVDLAVNWVMGLFGYEAKEGEEFSMRKLVLGAFTAAKEWVTKLFSWAEETTPEGEDGEWTLLGSILDAVKAPIRFIKDLFTFDSDFFEKGLLAQLGIVSAKLIDLVYWPLNLAINFVAGLFGWDEDEMGEKKTWSVSQLVTDAITAIWEWFSNLLDIDVDTLIKSIPGAETLLGWFQSSDQDRALAEATESGLYDKDWAGASEINRDMVGEATRAQLEAIIADNDLREADKQFILDEIQRRATGGAVSAATPYLVGETGPELFVPTAAGSVLSAGRTERLFQGASEASALARDGGGAAPVVINNAPTTNNMSGGGGSGGSVFPVSVGDPDPKFRMVAANAF